MNTNNEYKKYKGLFGCLYIHTSLYYANLMCNHHGTFSITFCLFNGIVQSGFSRIYLINQQTTKMRGQLVK